MLQDKSSSAIVAVRDVDRARSFYRDTLGLSLLRRRGKQKAGAVLIATAAGLSLLRREKD